MIVAFCIGVAGIMLGAAAWKVGWEIPAAAGAGAPASIMMAAGIGCWVASVFSFGVSVGMWLCQ